MFLGEIDIDDGSGDVLCCLIRVAKVIHKASGLEECILDNLIDQVSPCSEEGIWAMKPFY
jgi:hypothetical protein